MKDELALLGELVLSLKDLFVKLLVLWRLITCELNGAN